MFRYKLLTQTRPVRSIACNSRTNSTQNRLPSSTACVPPDAVLAKTPQVLGQLHLWAAQQPCLQESLKMKQGYSARTIQTEARLQSQ
jgi:hypothetical protein